MDDLNNFFNPKSIAIIGASENILKVGGILVSKALNSSAEIIPINPGHDELLGEKCYKSVLDFKGKIDLAVIAIPSEFVVDVLSECGEKKIKNVILISAGFSEAGNKSGVEKILKVSKKYGIKFLGSNCFGVCNPSKKLDLTFSTSTPRDGNVAFISQSGALWSYVSDLNFGISKFVSLGNMENLEFSDFLEYFSMDKKIKSIVLYVEKLKDGKRFMEICKRTIKNDKKIYVIKGGSSSVGERAAISHTASLASDYAVYRGAMKQCGAIVCDSFLEAFYLANNEKIKNKKFNFDLGKSAFILTNAGGAGVLLSDYLSRQGVEIIEKPLDILGTARSEDYVRAFEEIKNKKFETLFVVVTPQSMTDVEEVAEAVLDFKKELARMNKRVMAVFLGGKSMKRANEIFRKNGIEFVNEI